MGNPWTVTPETVRVELSWGELTFWLDLKKGLTAGEAKRMNASAFRSISRRDDAQSDEDVDLNINWDSMLFNKARTYLAAWSLADDDGKKMPLTIDALKSLHPQLLDVIERAIDAHVVDMQALEKKVQTGDSKPEAISAS
tara:strand:- start:20356 stop:20775 length:420 start_codon:yes stop_codon:yes gene_type:complete